MISPRMQASKTDTAGYEANHGVRINLNLLAMRRVECDFQEKAAGRC